MTSLSTLAGINLAEFESHLKQLTFEFLKFLRKHRKNLPIGSVTKVKSSGSSTSYEDEQIPEWSHLTLAAHKAILSFKTPNDLLTFINANPGLKNVLLDSLPVTSSRRIPSQENKRKEREIQSDNLHTRLIDPFLRHYISEARSLNFKKGVFKSTFDTLKRALVSSKDEGIIVCPISNLIINSERINLDNGMVIRKIKDKEIEEWISAGGWSHPPLTFSELTKLKCAIQFPFSKEREYKAAFGGYMFTTADFNPEREQIKKILTPLQLSFDAKLEPTFLDIRITNGFFERDLFYAWKDIYHHDCKLNGKSLRSFRKISKYLNKPLMPNLELAIKKWDDSKDRDNAEDALLDYWGALETLFIRDTNPEKQYRVVSRIVSFLGKKKKERGMLFDLLKESYNYRSCIVHGSPKELKKIRADKKRQGEVISWTRIYLKKAILKFLERGGSIDIDALNIERKLAERGAGKL